VNIIFNRKSAEELAERYIVLELETFDVEGQKLECFCIVPGDRIPANELPAIDRYTKLHQTLVEHIKQKNYTPCEELIGHLVGRFGGELDSFYQIILERVKAS
jgi:hypothetical protein